MAWAGWAQPLHPPMDTRRRSLICALLSQWPSQTLTHTCLNDVVPQSDD